MNTIPESVQRVRPVLGTFVAIDADGAHDLEGAVSAAFTAAQRVDTLMRPSSVGSDVWRISAAAPGKRLQIDVWTYAVLELAHRVHGDSDGVFDPCRPTKPGRLTDLELHAPDAVVCRAPVALDLGGIAKGFAVDRAIDELRRHGCANGFVSAGGDVRCFGARTRRVLLDRPEAALEIDLIDAAVAVSAPRSDRSPKEHVGYYVGTTRELVTGRWTAVIAAEAAVADALCKCVMLTPPPAAARVLALYGARRVIPPS